MRENERERERTERTKFLCRPSNFPEQKKIRNFLFFFFSFWWAWGLLGKQVLYHLSHISSHFALVILER
jgi:hypothetical protein